MPTGYTAGIKDNMTFDQFVWGCARAMGALVLMRDEPADAPIPERLEPSTYHPDQLDKAGSRLDDLQSMSAEDADSAAKSAYDDEAKQAKEAIQEANALRSKYIKMLNRVNDWVSPTNDHDGFKDFMVEQLEKSIKFDCSTDYWETQNHIKLSGAEWMHKALGKALKDIEYHKVEYAKEIERTEDRNKWISKLRNSLKQPVKT